MEIAIPKLLEDKLKSLYFFPATLADLYGPKG